MIVIAERQETVPDETMQKASLVVQKTGKTYRVLKQRWSNRRVLREDEVLGYHDKYRPRALTTK